MPIKEFAYLSGKGRWAKFFVPSDYFKYTVDLSLDNKSLGVMFELKKKGIKNSIKNVDGEYWVTVSTPSQVETKTKGTVILEKPKVYNKDGSPWDPKMGIGNGSMLTCKMWLRKYKDPKTQKDAVSMRLDSVVVEDHIPYTPKMDMEEPKEAEKVNKLLENTSQPWMT